MEHLAWQNIQSSSDEMQPSNAWTTSHSIGYFSTSDSSDLDIALKNLFSITQELKVSEEEATQEIDIIQREYDFRVAENPYYHAYQEMTALIYENGPLSVPVLGTPDHISTFTLDQARDLHAETHTIENATLLVYGGFTEREIRRALQNVADDYGFDLEDLGASCHR